MKKAVISYCDMTGKNNPDENEILFKMKKECER